MKILLLTSVDHPQIRFEAEMLRKFFEVDYVALNNLNLRSKDAFITFLKSFPQIFVTLFCLRFPPIPPVSFLNHLLIAGYLIGNKKILKEKYNVIYAHWLFPAGFVGLILSKILDIKVISVVWGYDIQIVQGVKKYGIRGSLRILSKNVIRKSDLVIVNHRVHKRIAEELLGGRSNNIVYIPPAIPDISVGVREELTEELKERLSSLNAIDELKANHIVLYSPALTSIYGIMEFVKAIPEVLSKVDNCIFIIVGEGELKDRAINYINEMKLDDKVFFLGRVSHESMKILYKISTIVCDLAYSGTGTTTLEAFCFGKPVIGINTPKSVIKHGENGFLIKRGDHYSLANYVVKILKNSYLRERLSRNARDVFEKSFSMRNRMRNLFKLFYYIMKRETNK
ncbi:MAG: glycosyltransferase family 4 protein [archaeon GB-1845-036]|nr:glycosyltransferase family 4 protein [Candidatus Culexmicrobium thermophilum]